MSGSGKMNVYNPPVMLGGVTVAAGERTLIDIPVARLPTETWLQLPIEVVNGLYPGPRLWIAAAVHGDELNGMEIIRRVLEHLQPTSMSGTVIAAPIVNVFGFIEQSRYLPDRRDLNRSFPGSPNGSVAARIAHLFMDQVVNQCSYGIDLHTGSNHRTNYPQIRGNLQDAETRRCAQAFAAPVMMHAETLRGSLREAATKRGACVLLYEGGEPLRFDPHAIDVGVAGVLRVLAALNMVRSRAKRQPSQSIELGETTWVRARRGGILRLDVELGQHVKARQRLGVIGGALGTDSVAVLAPEDGIVIGLTQNPLVNQGDSIVHLGSPVDSLDD
ncbi:MAG: succinylglutamate desuccinylase/aspartoacylase family protein [Pirellulaceae bacterium]|nr:succinylglutamate desuccinylase/aspartoacylase family protein [Planctomycetales bacterium]MCA9220401.1 succinylglutamate desuccinylase/aspartoacylase family protein [Planctomycetales bacterium]MCA9224853.1 succinylglutamate desuccinylase/aspartoacylase family protein [Planctomycetales bacterium]